MSEKIENALREIADQLKLQNLIACSQPVYIKDAPDRIREHFGEAPLGNTEFDRASLTASFEGHLRQGLEEYFTEEEFTGSIFRDLEDGEVGVDGMLDLPKIARYLAAHLMHRG